MQMLVLMLKLYQKMLEVKVDTRVIFGKTPLVKLLQHIQIPLAIIMIGHHI
jgi:hypothetical protein